MHVKLLKPNQETHTHSFWQTHPTVLIRVHTFTHSHPHSLSLSPSHTHTHTHTHTHGNPTRVVSECHQRVIVRYSKDTGFSCVNVNVCVCVHVMCICM